LAYLSRYAHRVAISNRRLIAFDEAGATTATAGQNQNSHRPAQAARKFVLGRFSYASRRPKTFTTTAVGAAFVLS